MYEQLLSWMCTQEQLVDEAETIIRKEMPVRHPLSRSPQILSGTGWLERCAPMSHIMPPQQRRRMALRPTVQSRLELFEQHHVADLRYADAAAWACPTT